jgi:hypothetical protein
MFQHREQEQQYHPREETGWWGSRAEKGLREREQPFHKEERGYGGFEQQRERGVGERFGGPVEKGGYDKFGLGKGVETLGVGNIMVTKNIEREGFTLSELMHVHVGLLITGQCYIKEHILMMLLGGGHTREEELGFNEVKAWHDNVTRKNLRVLYQLANQMQLPLPFQQPLEKREEIIKRCLSQVGPVLTPLEALAEVKIGAMHLAHFWTQSAMTSLNETASEIFQDCAKNVFNEIHHLKGALKKLDYCPMPIVTSFKTCDTGVVSHTEKRDAGGVGQMGIGQTGFGQHEYPRGSERSVGDRGIGERGIPSTSGIVDQRGTHSPVQGGGMGPSRQIPIR